jgi:serine/threonine protein kinase/Tol biopolymer transport system component
MFTTDALAAALAGRYTIERLVGEGGMAKVYLARDLRHNRRVALKVLRPDLGAVVGVERFQAEIQVTANLQHPNLLPLFDSGAAGDLLFYVMPFVEGESLRQRLDREKQLPVDEAIRIATLIGGALEYAHRKGVIHRDLKPENVLLNEGQPLVADFGIALAISNAGGARITQTGLSLGTPQYMSPEQATGDRVIDARTDIYSLGALTYEMLTGEPPHTGNTAQAIIARVLTEKPRGIRATRASVPEYVEAAVDRALEKLPADRFETAKAFSEALANPSWLAFARGTRATTPSGVIRSRLRDPAFLAIGLVAIGAAATAASLAVAARHSSDADAHAPAKFALEVSDSVRIGTGNGRNVSISRDGRQIVYVGVNSKTGKRLLYLRQMDDPVAQPVRGTEYATGPAFSPDGQSLAFVRRVDAQDQTLMVVPTTGGTPRRVSTSVLFGITWSDDTHLVGTPRENSLFVVSSDGGSQRLLFKADSARGVQTIGRPEMLPGGEWLLLTYWRTTNRNDAARLAVVSTKDGSFEDLGIAGSNAQYAEPGYLVFGRNVGEVYAVPFSLARRRVTGSPVLLLRDVRIAGNATLSLSVSSNGTMVFQPVDDVLQARDARPLTMVVVDKKGVERPLLRDTLNYESPRLSPDGRRIAVTIGGAGSNGVGSSGTWVIDIANGTKARISTDSNSFRGEWSRDGSSVYYRQQLTGSAVVWARPWNASAPPRIVARGAEDALYEFSFGPPHGLAVIRNKTSGPRANINTDIVIAPVDSLDSSRPLFPSTASIVNARVSPDGKFVAYASNETGRAEVYVMPIPGPGPHVLVSVDGGEEPAWSWDGGTIYYRTPLPNSRMMAATITQRPALAVSRRDTLFIDTYARQTSHSAYDVFPDGRLLMTKEVGGGSVGAAQAYVILHWQKLLERLTPSAAR